MVDLYGMKIKDINRYVGSMEQIMGAREFAFRNGRQDGVKGIEVYNDTGFRFTVLPDRGMDIGSTSYCGKSITWDSKNGVIAPQYYENGGLGFLRNFGGGLVATCGLTNAGSDCVDEEEVLGIHDRINNIPVKRYSIDEYWENEKYVISIKGRVQQSCLYYENMVLERQIKFKMGETKINIHDTVINEGYNDTPFMLLYHINFGFPVVTEDTKVYTPAENVTPWSEYALKGNGKALECQQPTPHYQYECFTHDMPKNKEVYSAIVNERMKFGGYIKYSTAQLPCMINWKMMGGQDYVAALEPGTNIPEGRIEARNNNRLKVMSAGERYEIDLEIGLVDGEADIERTKTLIRK